MIAKGGMWLVAAVALAAAVAWAEPEGAAVKTGENLVQVTVNGAGADKDEAIRDAQRKAVERGAGTFIYSQSETKDFALVKDTVLARAAGFLQSFKVLSEKDEGDGTWSVKISAEVSIKGIQDAWGAVTTLMQQVGRPKIMVVINEKVGREEVEDSTVQTAIVDELLKSGFAVVDREQLKDIDKKDLAAAAAEDSPARVQAIAKRFGAQMFIKGSANATPGVQKDIGGVLFFTFEGDANIRCFRTDTAQIMSSIAGAPTRGVQQVARSAAKQALDLQARYVSPRLVNDILMHWQDAISGRGEVQLKVEDVSFANYTKLKNNLKTLRNVKDVNGTYANKVAELSIQSDITGEQLAEKLVSAMPELEITDVTQNVIKAKFKPEAAK